MTHRATRPHSRWYGLSASLAILTVLSVIAIVGGRWVAENTDVSFPASTPWGPECSAWTGGDEEDQIHLERDQAQRATTAAAVNTQGDSAPIDAPDTDDIPDEVMTVLEEGPDDDAGPSLTCRSADNADLEVEEDLESSGLTPRAQNLKDGMEGVFSDLSLGGYTPGGYDSGHGEDSAHYEGRAIDVFYRPVTEENRREGWIMSHWLIAHAPDYEVAVIIFDDKIWSTAFSSLGWRDYDADPDDEILRHLDHVHVDVQRGSDPAEAG